MKTNAANPLFSLLVAILIVVFSNICSAAGTPAQPMLDTAAAARLARVVELLDTYRGDSSSLAEAEMNLNALLKSHPRLAPAYRERARLLIMQGHLHSEIFRPGSLEAADAALNKSLALNPKYAEAYVLRGHLYRLMGRTKAAYAALEMAEKLGTTDPWLQNNWADLLIDDDKHDEAAARYQKVIDSNTSNRKAMASALEGMIDYYVRTGRNDKAGEMHRRNIEFDPGVAWAHGNYAQFLLCRTYDVDASIVQSREALKLMDYGVGRYWLAAALYIKWSRRVVVGRPEEGKDFFAEASELYPDVAGIAARSGSCRILSGLEPALKMTQSSRPQ